MNFQSINPYPWIRPLLFMIDAEQMHEITLILLAQGLSPRFKNNTDPKLAVKVAGLNFPNPIGLAAGFDKQAEVIPEMFGFGFGSVEVGSITPLPQEGNPQPRLIRVPENDAIINRFGFNSHGFDACLRRIIAYRDATVRKPPGILGVNIGKNKDTANPVGDYVDGVTKFAPFTDYLTINISSPNTEGLRDMQIDGLDDLLKPVMEARNASARKPPVFLKIAPDLHPTQLKTIADSALAHNIDGIIVGNTTVSRPEYLPALMLKEPGGLSGKPLFELSNYALADMYRFVGGKIPLIGCGGVSSAEDAYTKIRMGASLVQLYTALIYQGPLLVPRINRELAALLARDGFATVADAVGTAVPPK